MAGAADDVPAPPDSWELEGVDDSMRRLMLSATAKQDREGVASPAPAAAAEEPVGVHKVEEGSIARVDQFLREALQNSRERLLVLRIEQDVLKFIHDPTLQQMEFQQLPASYLRLAAHRVAQHYCLQSMVLPDSNFPDGSNSRIIVRKTLECRVPSIRLADIPVNLPSPDNNIVNVAIKQRPLKRSQNLNILNSDSINSNSSKSVEERKEEYNIARARIFYSNAQASRKPEMGLRYQENSSSQQSSLGLSGTEEKVEAASLVDEKVEAASLVDENILGRGPNDSPENSSGLSRSRSEKDPIGRYRPNNRVAIFWDQEVDRKDPDYDRNYDRYMQRFDPGFGFSGGIYTVPPLYVPALNYNTEFPQLGSTPRPQVSPIHQTRPLPQHLSGHWTAPSIPAGIAYSHPDMIAQYSLNPVGSHSSSAYLPSSQYACQRPGLPFLNPQEHVQPFTQSHLRPQTDACFGLARPR